MHIDIVFYPKLGFENPALQIVPIKKRIVEGEWHVHIKEPCLIINQNVLV